MRPSNQPRCPVTKPERKVEVSCDSRKGGSAEKPLLPSFCHSDAVSPSAAQKKRGRCKTQKVVRRFFLSAPTPEELRAERNPAGFPQQHPAFLFRQIENLHLFTATFYIFFFFFLTDVFFENCTSIAGRRRSRRTKQRRQRKSWRKSARSSRSLGESCPTERCTAK